MCNHDEKASVAAWDFYRIKEAFECDKQDFEATKLAFYDMMSEYFTKKNRVSTEFVGEETSDPPLIVRRVDKTIVEWDAEKLEKRVDKSISKQVIKKQYRIVDMEGLIEYLRSCGVDPKIFKRFIAVDKSVDEKAIDRLGDTGFLTVKQIAGCYTVKSQKPYYTVKLKE